MQILLLEVSCNVTPNSDQWNDFLQVQLEIGYPATGCKTIWKHIGWAQLSEENKGKHFVHLLWNAQNAKETILTDFLSVKMADTGEIERSYKIRRIIRFKDGRQKSTLSKTLKGDYEDEFIRIVWK